MEVLSDVTVSSADQFFQNKNCHKYIVFGLDVLKTIPILSASAERPLTSVF